LVLFGNSRGGKTTLAKSLFPNAFVQTVQSADAPDLRGFDYTHHKMVVFDNVNSSDFILNYRALTQANNDMHVLRQSSTGMYAYKVWLWRVPIVLTVDSQAAWDRENPWVSENCYEVSFDEPCYTLAD